MYHIVLGDRTNLYSKIFHQLHFKRHHIVWKPKLWYLRGANKSDRKNHTMARDTDSTLILQYNRISQIL